jgi:hypothetical protein
MKIYLRLTVVSLLLAVFGASCKQNVAPPVAIPIEQLPAALEKAFKKAKPEAKELVGQVVAAVQTPDYSKAYFTMQTLSGQPGLNREQTGVANGGLLTLNTLMQEAQAKGDAKAAEALKFHRENK